VAQHAVQFSTLITLQKKLRPIAARLAFHWCAHRTEYADFRDVHVHGDTTCHVEKFTGILATRGGGAK
jgi:hypothetical protein